MDRVTLIGERFKVERLAGAGGMGKVYKARDLQGGELVAVKVIGRQDVERARFERECALLATLHHPAIVRHVSHGLTEEGEPFLAMEWLEGEDLGKRLKRAELSLDEAMILGRKVGEALQEAHRRGVVHRDLKPGNLLLCEGSVERVKVIDFGIAHVGSARPLTRTGHMVGTPGYIAPEQARGEKRIDGRADVFSLGCVLWRCIAGKAPFPGEDVLAVLLKLALEETPRLRDARPDLPEALDDLLARMMAKSPDDRPRDGGAVAAELAALAAGLDDAPPAPISRAVVTASEQRVLCVIIARAAEAGEDVPTTLSGSETEEVELSAVVEGHGGHLHLMPDGSMFVTLSDAASFGGSTVVTGAATDQAARAARCALALRALLPGAAMVLVAGRTVLSGCVPSGDAIDRGLSMLERAGADAVRIDGVIAGLLDARFDVRPSAGGASLFGERRGEGALRTLLGRPAACVGRDAELARIASLVEEAVAEPAARAVLVTAPAGVGKSRLCHELLRLLPGRSPGVQVWLGRADMMSAGSPFAALGAALRHACGIQSGEPVGLRRRKVAERAARHVTGAEEARRIAGLLGGIAGVTRREDGPWEPQATGDLMRSAWIDWLRAEVSAGPRMIVLEDLHWGDLPSVSFIDAALRDLAEEPLVVLALARPEVHEIFPRLWADRALTEVKLGPLSRRASARLVRQALGDAAPGGVVDAIVARAEGNAFYLEELIRAASEGQGDAVPETVLAMVQARLSRLDPDLRRLLRAASVFGGTFWKGGLSPLLGREDAAALDDRLAALVDLEVIERQRASRFEGDEEYAFRHALVRDAAYAMLTGADRELVHARAGDFLERAGEEDALALAEHFQRGGRPDRALGWYRRAAERALAVGDLDGAIQRAERAAECGAAGQELGALRLVQAEALNWQSQYARSLEVCGEALPLLPRGGALYCHALGGQIIICLLTGRADRFAELAGELASLQPDPAAMEGYVRGLATVAAALCLGGMYDAALHLMARVEELVRSTGMADPVALGWVRWAKCTVIKCTLADPWQHLTLIEGAVEALGSHSDPRITLVLQTERGCALASVGLFEEAEQVMRRLYDRARSLGASQLADLAESYIAQCLVERGCVEEARALAQEALGRHLRADAHITASILRWTLVRIRLRLGDVEGAAREIEEAPDEPHALPQRAVERAIRARVYLASGQAGRALPLVEEAARILDGLGAIVDNEALVRLTYAEVLRAAGRERAGREALTAARDRLLARAAGIEDAAIRRSFLERVEINRLTLARAEEWGV